MLGGADRVRDSGLDFDFPDFFSGIGERLENMFDWIGDLLEL